MGNNMLFINSGFSFSAIVALRLAGKGNVTDSIKWINKKIRRQGHPLCTSIVCFTW